MTKEIYDYMESAGLPCPEIFLDGKVHRYSSDGSREKSEWYIGYKNQDGSLVVVFNSWKRMGDNFVFCSKTGKEISQEEKLRIKKLEREARTQFKADVEQNKTLAKGLYQSLNETSPDNAYLSRKKIGIYPGLKKNGNSLIVPIYAGGEFLSYQVIAEDGTKRFARGIPVKYGYYPFKGDTDVIYLAEGFATGASIFEATNSSVYVSFSASNLIHVAKKLKEAMPNQKIILCADLGKAGEDSAVSLAKIGIESVFPKFKYGDEGNDFNDMAVLYGLEAVKQQIKKKDTLGMCVLDFLDLDIPPLEFLAYPILPKGSVNFLYADAGCCKSWIAMELSWCIAVGCPFLLYPVEKSFKVLYIEGEMSHAEIQERMKFFWENYAERGFKPDRNNFKLITNEMIKGAGKDVDLFNPLVRQEMDAIINEYDLVVLDNYSALTDTFTTRDGGEFENKSSSWKGIHDWMEQWKMKGKTFLVLHHASKNGSLKGTGRMAFDASTIIKLKSFTVGDNEEIDERIEISYEKLRHGKGKEKNPMLIELKLDRLNKSKWQCKKKKIKVDGC